jgi:penicillin-binding protein 1A
MNQNQSGGRSGGPRINFERVETEAGAVAYRRSGRATVPERQPGLIGRILRRMWRILFSKAMLCVVGSLLFTTMILASIGLIYYARLLPDISGLAAAKEQPGLEILAEDGSHLARYGQISGEYIPYSQLPKALIDAVIATEDRRFFSHIGVDPMGILRAAVVNVTQGSLRQGGSTVTQQLAKNIFLTSERTFSRKIQELMMSFWLEQKFTKEEIIAIYLNRVYFGGGSYGVDAAARYYFDKSVAQLDLVECAMLAGLLKAPSRYNPTSNAELAIGRTEQVIRNMVDAEKITQADGETAIALLGSGTKQFKQEAHDNIRYFSDWVLEQLPEYIGEPTEDVIVHTTLEPKWQEAADAAIAQVMTDQVRKAQRAREVALLAMRPNGAVVSMIGGRDYNLSQYNRATHSKRQPGSAFKLFVYLAAMEQGYFPDMVMVDEPIQIGKWRPGNYKDEYRGAVSIKQALSLSLNTISVKLSQRVGIDAVRNVAKRLGIKSEMSSLPSLALGALEVSLQEMVTAYAHLANNGRAVKPYGIVEVRRKRDNAVLYARTDRDDFSDVTVIAPENVAKMNEMLSGVIGYGTGKGANIGRPAAGKTGTTSNYKDAWFLGYTPNLVAGVWVGNDDARPTAKVTGGSLPARIWQAYMKQSLVEIAAKALPMAYPAQAQAQPALPWLQAAPEQDASPQGTQPAAPVPATPAAPSYQLKESFWDTLFDENKVEYDYPNR